MMIKARHGTAMATADALSIADLSFFEWRYFEVNCQVTIILGRRISEIERI